MAEQPDMDSKTIRRLTGVSERTQFRVRALLRDTGEVVRTPIVDGRPRKLDSLDAAVSQQSFRVSAQLTNNLVSRSLH